MGAKRGDPLRRMFVVAPASLMLLKDLLGGCGEGRNWNLVFELLGDWVAAFTGHLTIAPGFLTRFAQRDQANAAQTNIAPPALDDCPQHPAPSTRRINDEVETVSIGITARRLDLPNLNGA